MPMAPVMAGDEVGSFQRGDDADIGCFLTGAEMDKTGYEPRRVEPANALFEMPDQHHRAIHIQHAAYAGLGVRRPPPIEHTICLQQIPIPMLARSPHLFMACLARLRVSG